MNRQVANESMVQPSLSIPSGFLGRNTLMLAIAAALATASISAAAPIWNLAADWSNTDNPNGVWSYNSAPGEPITTSWPDWDPDSNNSFGSPQPAWAAAPFPQNDHVPVWFKRISDSAGMDIPLGEVGMHGPEWNDPVRWVGVSWTNPQDHPVHVFGSVWYAHPGAGRSADWRVRLNDTELTAGTVAEGDGHPSDNPFRLSEGSGGADALRDLVISPADMIAIEFISETTWSCFAGLDVQIVVCPADVNGDGWVDIDDLFAVLGGWGPCDGCPEDVNYDGVVDIDDVFEILAAWGPCP